MVILKYTKFRLFNLCWILYFFISSNLSAQVLSNTGASFTVISGTSIFGISGINNNTGSISNDGTINTGNLINAGTLSGNGLLNVRGNLTNSGTFTAGSGTVNLNGTASQTIPPLTFHNLTISNTTGACLATGNITVNNNLTTLVNSVLDMSAYQLNVNLVDHSGILKTQNSSATPFSAAKIWGGTVELNGTTGSQTLVSGTYADLKLTNTLGASVSGPVIINGTLFLNSGSLAIGSNSLTFQNANIPLSKVSGTLATGNGSNLVFGTPGNTAGAAFTMPDNIFATVTTINNLTVNRQNSLTLGNQTLSVRGIVLANGPLNTNGKLILLSDATQTAMIDGSGAGEISGNVTMQSYLPSGFGYKYLSSPFQSALLSELAQEVNLNDPFPPVYYYDENLNTAGWKKYIDAAGVLNPLQGYAVNLGSTSAAKTIEMSGQVNNGSKSITLFNHNQTFTKGFNLVGNPYPSPIDWNSVTGWVKTNIDNALYFFRASSTDQYGGTYSSYINGIPSEAGISGVIPAMQGFFVHVSDGTIPISGSLSINNAARINTNATARILKGKGELLSTSAAGFKTSDLADSKTLLRLQASFKQESAVSDPAVIYFDDLASLKFDKEFDALKLMNTDPSVPSLYTISSDVQNLSINALPSAIDSIVRIPVGIKTEMSGFINFNASSLNGLPYSMKVYFRDANTNTLHDLRKDATYSVHLDPGKYDNRFSILFSLKEQAIEINSQNSLKAFYSNGYLNYQLQGIKEDSKASLMISNIKGQVLKRADFSGSMEQKLQMELIPGVYIISSVAENKQQYKKIIVN